MRIQRSSKSLDIEDPARLLLHMANRSLLHNAIDRTCMNSVVPSNYIATRCVVRLRLVRRANSGSSYGL